jgi:coproporphyrinogen III oxidase
VNPKETWIAHILDLQDRVCQSLERADGGACFIEDKWSREDGGGGRTRVISNGYIFEKGGVNTSTVFGNVTDVMRSQLQIAGDKWFACGLSLVLHPKNPFVPTVHCNYRMFELYDEQGNLSDRWFGGGTDLTPYYLFPEDARHFHQAYKNVCDGYGADLYPRFKNDCDNYFVNWHRGGERRGIGGIFFDHLRPSPGMDTEFWMQFCIDCGNAFIPAYLPIAEARMTTPFSSEHRHWQEIRRGRYVEFNLLHDRGTLFGIKTNGRAESILMSLPPTARFEYNFQPSPGSAEQDLLDACLHPRTWVDQ